MLTPWFSGAAGGGDSGAPAHPETLEKIFTAVTTDVKFGDFFSRLFTDYVFTVI